MLTREDTNKWVNNTLVFLAPIALIYLGHVQTELSNGFNPEDFVPNNILLGSLMLYVVNVIYDFFRKLLAKPETPVV